MGFRFLPIFDTRTDRIVNTYFSGYLPPEAVVEGIFVRYPTRESFERKASIFERKISPNIKDADCVNCLDYPDYPCSGGGYYLVVLERMWRNL